MKKTEAVYIIDCIAKGIDPITGEMAEDGSFINDVSFVRKMFEIKDFIIENIEDEEIVKTPFTLTNRENIVDCPTSMSVFVEKINEANSIEGMKKMTRTPILGWLLDNGYLEKIDGKTRIASKGSEAGIFYEKRVRYGGREYDVITYPEEMQMHILDLIESGEISKN